MPSHTVVVHKRATPCQHVGQPWPPHCSRQPTCKRCQHRGHRRPVRLTGRTRGAPAYCSQVSANGYYRWMHYDKAGIGRADKLLQICIMGIVGMLLRWRKGKGIILNPRWSIVLLSWTEKEARSGFRIVPAVECLHCCTDGQLIIVSIPVDCPWFLRSTSVRSPSFQWLVSRFRRTLTTYSGDDPSDSNRKPSNFHHAWHMYTYHFRGGV